MYEHTPNLKHTIVNKGSMKTLQRFIQLEMKEHNLKVETTKMNQQHGIRFFKEAHPLGLNLARQSQVWTDVIQCCMMIGWTYLESSSFILFASNLEWLVTKIPKEIFSQLYFQAYFTRVLQQKVKTHYLLKVLVLGQELILGKPFNCTQVGEVVSLPTSTFVYLSS